MFMANSHCTNITIPSNSYGSYILSPLKHHSSTCSSSNFLPKIPSLVFTDMSSHKNMNYNYSRVELHNRHTRFHPYNSIACGVNKRVDKLSHTTKINTKNETPAMKLSYIINDDVQEEPNKHFQTSTFENSISSPHLPKQNYTTQVEPVTSPSSFDVSDLLNIVCAKPDCGRVVRGPRGTFCKYHKQSRFCRAEGCSKSAKTGGCCISHGGGKRCSHFGCNKSAKQGGLCISHGGGRRCNELSCTKSALVGGFCSAHGGGRKCKFLECSKTALLGGFCIAHGGGKRCQLHGCSKSAVGGTYCVSHGGGKRCQAHDCNKGAVRHGVCIRHGAKREKN